MLLRRRILQCSTGQRTERLTFLISSMTMKTWIRVWASTSTRKNHERYSIICHWIVTICVSFFISKSEYDDMSNTDDEMPKKRGWEGTYRSIFVHRYGVTKENPWSCISWRLNSPRWNPVLQVLTICRTVCVEWVGIPIFFWTYTKLLDGIIPPSSFVVSRTALSAKSFVVDDQDRIVRSLNTLRSLTLCICDNQILTTTYCFGLRQYVISCVHAA